MNVVRPLHQAYSFLYYYMYYIADRFLHNYTYYINVMPNPIPISDYNIQRRPTCRHTCR